MSGVILVTLTISLAALVFRGDLESGLPIGVGITLFGTLAIGIVGVFGSGLDGVVAGVQDNTAAVIGTAAAAIAAGVSAEKAVPTVVAFIVVASFLTAVSLGGIGLFRWGALVRYVPYPVIGGFMVATGVLILDGARTILFVNPDGSALWSATSASRWLPGIAVGLVALLLTRYQRVRPALPLLILTMIAAVHAAMAIGGVDRATAVDRGWLLRGFAGEGALWQPDVVGLLGEADWGAVAGQAGALATVIALAVISMMIKVQAMDQATGQDIDVDHELRVAGISVAAAVPGAGMPGYMHFSQTLMLRNLAGPRRGPALIAALMAGVVLTVGGSVLTLVPTALVGGLLVYLGLLFLVDWLWDRRTQLERTDYLLVVAAGGAVVLLGFLPAITLGTVVAIVLFVIRYSRVDVVRRGYTLRVLRSTIDRSPAETEVLEETGDRAVVLEVSGFLFFGTAHRVFEDSRLGNPDADLRFVILDLSRVTGVDSSTSMALGKFARRAEEEGFQVILAALPDAAAGITSQLSGSDGVVHQVPTLDAAAEFCEEGLLDRRHGGQLTRPSLESLVAAELGSHHVTRTLLDYFDRIDLDDGALVIEHGAQSAGMYFIEAGTLTALLEAPDGTTVRLRVMQSGTLFGEIGLYLGGATTADVVATGPARVLHLTPAALAEMEASHPAAAAAVHRLAAKTLADRVLYSERALRTFRE
jgi:SulP family sulfate permease